MTGKEETFVRRHSYRITIYLSSNFDLACSSNRLVKLLRFFSWLAKLIWPGPRCRLCPYELHASAPRSERGRAGEVPPDGAGKAPATPFLPLKSRKAILRGGLHPCDAAGQSRRQRAGPPAQPYCDAESAAVRPTRRSVGVPFQAAPSKQA